jgi:hypothetical protein
LLRLIPEFYRLVALFESLSGCIDPCRYLSRASIALAAIANTPRLSSIFGYPRMTFSKLLRTPIFISADHAPLL